MKLQLAKLNVRSGPERIIKVVANSSIGEFPDSHQRNISQWKLKVAKLRPYGDLNQLGRYELSKMPKGKPTSAGPMSVQPVARNSIAPTQLLMMPTAGAGPKTLPKKPSPRTEAVRIAKARIMRRNSLRKQRQAQSRAD